MYVIIKHSVYGGIDGAIGKKVEAKDGNDHYEIKGSELIRVGADPSCFDKNYEYYFSKSSVKETNKFEVGDKVKIVKNYKDYSYLGIPEKEVDHYYGKVMVINQVNPTTHVFENQWAWNDDLLEKVEELTDSEKLDKILKMLTELDKKLSFIKDV